ncbi:MAG: hypothetical protein ABJF50_18825 [Paracoccaceae bacterium]
MSLVIVQYASFAAVVGLAVSLIASAVLLQNRRAAYAKLSLFFALLGVTFNSLGGGLMWMALILYLTLVSIVEWPTKLKWVNWPLLSGAGVFALAAVYAGLMQQTHPCRY